MSDLFHEKSSFEFTMRCFLTMLRAPQHTYQILTKRPRRMAEFSDLFVQYFGRGIPPHIWMGTSVESAGYTHRIDDLRRVRCHTRFISFEPLLRTVGSVDLSNIHWAIIGGESGPNHRPVREEWVRSLITECRRQRVPVFFKQWGGLRPKSGGREIDGRTYDEYPAVKPDANPIPAADIEGFDARRENGGTGRGRQLTGASWRAPDNGRKKKTAMRKFGGTERVNHDSGGFYARRMFAGNGGGNDAPAARENCIGRCANAVICGDSTDVPRIPDSGVHLMVMFYIVYPDIFARGTGHRF